MNLLAQAEAASQALPQLDWGDLLFNKGPLVAVFGTLLLALIWYGPKFIQSHFDFIEHAKATQTAISANMDKLTETQREIRSDVSEQRKLAEKVVNLAESFRCKHTG